MAFAERRRLEFAPLREASTQQQDAEEQRRRAVAAAIAGGSLVVVGDTAAPVAGVPKASARAAAAGTILAGVVAYLATQRARMRSWLRERTRRQSPAASTEDIERVLASEEQRQAAFERKSAERFARDLTTALAIPDTASREAAVRGLTAREARYARMRDEATAARVFAAVDRVVLKQQSPAGGFWKLDPNVMEHTAGCLIMGGRFWPWQVLDRVHPPRHAGCPCRLIGYGDAIAGGLLAPGDVLDVRTAVRRAAGVVMEGALLVEPEDAEALIEAAGGRELMELRQALIAGDLADEGELDELLTQYVADDELIEYDANQPRYPKGHPRAGQWRPKIAAGGSGKRSSKGWLERDVADLRALIEPKHVGSTRTGDGPEAPIMSGPGSTVELQQVGKRLAAMADRFGTHHAYRERIDALHAERRTIMDRKSARIEEAGGYNAVAKKARGAAMGTGVSIGDYFNRYSTEEEQARVRAIDAEVAPLLVREADAKRDAIAGVLAQVRPMGGRLRTGSVDGESGGLKHAASGEHVAAHEASLRTVEKLLPAAWIDDSNAKGHVDYLLSKDRAWHKLEVDASPQDASVDSQLAHLGTGTFEPAFVGYTQDGRPVTRNGYGAVQAIGPKGELEMLRTDGNIDDVPGVTKAERRIRQRSMNSTVKVEAGDTSTLLHEVGHRLELARGETNAVSGLPPVLSATLRFLRERAGKSKARKLDAIYPNYSYDPWETAWEDKFVDAYIGKDYGGRVTEVLTMGLQGVYYPAHGRRFDPPKSSTSEKGDLPMRDFILGMLAAL